MGRGLAVAATGIGATPIAHPLDMDGTTEVVAVLPGPLPLAACLARFAALWFLAIRLLLGITVVREENIFATQALPFSCPFHDPVLPG